MSLESVRAIIATMPAEGLDRGRFIRFLQVQRSKYRETFQEIENFLASSPGRFLDQENPFYQVGFRLNMEWVELCQILDTIDEALKNLS
jgi:hypothetical protein